jgi:hypothetical protein
VETIFSIVVSSVISAGGTFWLLTTKIGEKYFTHHLDRKLESLRHEQNTKIEALRADLGHVADRGKRSNEREYDALAEVWERFVDAFLATNTAVMDWQEHPDFKDFSEEELRSFLSTTDLSKLQQEDVIKSADRNRTFGRYLTLRKLQEARLAIHAARMLLRKNGIFIPSSLADKLKSDIEMLSKAEVQRYVEFRHGGMRELKDVEYLLGNGERIFNELGALVRGRLLKE